MYDIITFTQEIPEKRRMILCIQIEKDVTIFDFIVITMKSIIYSIETIQK